ncbi:MAG: zinc-binding dehydrogenase [Actinomycetota bacterium]
MSDTNWSVDAFRRGETPLPTPNRGWNTYGRGVESVGRDAAPEPIEIPTPRPDQLLIRIDAVGLCFSDVKLINLGNEHPKLRGRDLATDPTRLGHEASVTVIEVGDDLADTYRPGQRLAIQPDIHVDGVSTAYGYSIPGGLIQYHLIGPEVLDADDGAYVIPLDDSLSYAAAALSEPWACVEASYTQRRRLEPLDGGIMWIIGSADDPAVYEASRGLDAPATIVLSDVSPQARALVEQHLRPDATILTENGIEPSGYDDLVARHSPDHGFDDIIVLDPRSAEVVENAARHIAFRGTMNLVGRTPLDRHPELDVGRLHYHYTAYVGTTGPDLAAAYGEARNRADLRPGGVAVYIGGAGPMGQMHMQRALEMDDGPALLVGSDLDDERLAAANDFLADLAAEKGRELVFVNPSTGDESLVELVGRLTDGRGADDVIVSVPSGPVMADAAALLAPDGMFVAFAGVANGTMAPLNASDVYLANAQFTGTSGSNIADQASVIEKAVSGALSPERSLAAVGGIEAGQEGLRAMIEGRYAGKIMIFPQLSGLPLTGLAELAAEHPEIEAAMKDGTWTVEAENALLRAYASA